MESCWIWEYPPISWTRGERGFSYNVDAPLDMRMSQSGLSARDIVNTYSVDELTRILREYGEERFAYKIARNIERHREQAPIETTFQLVEIIKESIPAPARRRAVTRQNGLSRPSALR